MDTDIGLLIAELGFPIVSALAVAGALWAILRWMMHSLHGEIQDLKARIDSTHNGQMDILVKLIDRVRRLEDSVTRTEIVVRTAHNLEQEWERIGRSKGGQD